MENKCIKTSVFANENIFEDFCEQPIDVDFTLPDYCPDISKIFKCKATCRIVSKGINGNNITVEGNVLITLLYCDRDNRLNSFEYQYPFSKIKESASDLTGGNLVCKAKCDYINCRAVTGRKVDIHGAVTVSIRVFKRKCNDIISDIDDCNIEVLRDTAPATIPMGYNEKYVIIEEEIPISNSVPPIQNVLRYDAFASIKESKIINDKVMVKGDMAVVILYCPEGEIIPQTIKTTLPFTQVIDIKGINDMCECEVKASLTSLEIKPKPWQNGENRSFLVNAKLLICCESYCVNDIAVIKDAFSRKFETDIAKNNLSFSKITQNIKEIHHLKKKIEIDENISSVLDLWCDVQSVSCKFEKENVLIYGTVLAGIIVCNQNSETSFFEKMMDFECKYPIKTNEKQMECSPEVEIESCGFTIISPNCIEVCVDLCINASIFEKTNISLITDMKVDSEKIIALKTRHAMTVYFTGENECVWDIARRYNASVDEIISINALDDNCLKPNTMILVPLV
jgi:hypothetical protein